MSFAAAAFTSIAVVSTTSSVLVLVLLELALSIQIATIAYRSPSSSLSGGRSAGLGGRAVVRAPAWWRSVACCACPAAWTAARTPLRVDPAVCMGPLSLGSPSLEPLSRESPAARTPHRARVRVQRARLGFRVQAGSPGSALVYQPDMLPDRPY